MNPWNFDASPSTSGLSHPTLTLVEGDSFCISDVAGDIHPGTAQGLFDRDTRFLSGWRFRLDGDTPEHLDLLPETPFAAGLLARARPPAGRADSTLLVQRRRYVGRGMREDIVLRNLAAEPAVARLDILVDADFAHLFEVKEERVVPRGERRVSVELGALRFDYTWRGAHRGVIVTATSPGATALDGVLTVPAVVPARGEWRTCIDVVPVMDGTPVRPRHPCGHPVEAAVPLRRLRQWRRSTSRINSGSRSLNTALSVSADDLGALRIFDPDFPDRAVVAAGAPWFMTLFGRDSLLTSWMALLIDPGLAAGTLRTLGRHQGTRIDPVSEEEPGRIPHELRWGDTRSLAHGEARLYYGTADATPLFVMLLGELLRWGHGADIVEELLPHADRALQWVSEYGDRDGDSFVEYQRATDEGLANQGWKDSWDGVTHADGRLAEPPIALCEVQGYVYAAYNARAELAAATGDASGRDRWLAQAGTLKRRFNDAFWLPDEGCFAVGLDRDKRPIDSIASNMGHCLWTGIVDDDKASAVAERLLAEDMFTGFGVRTLSSRMGAYNPVSYHNGSVWPHDNALIAAGLARYGHAIAAHRIILGLLDAAAAYDGRLPELFCGFDRADFASPIRYPTACSPQAWAAATPYLLVRTLLRLDPDLPQGSLSLIPTLPAEIGHLTLERVPLGGTRISARITGREVAVDGLPDGVVLRQVDATPVDSPAEG